MTKIYIKPSIVKPFTSGNSVEVTGMSHMDTYHDSMLGRLELGAKYSINKSLSACGFVSQTFGPKYQASAVGLGSW